MVAYSTVPRSVESELTDCLYTREQLVIQIQEFNPKARAAYLGRFPVRALETYLEHLRSASTPRGPAAWWIRPGDTPAIVGFEAED